MEVKIGVQHAPRELVLESGQSHEDIEKAVAAAFKSPDGVLTLVDDKGRRVIVPVTQVAYVEIAEPNTRRVGFGAV